MHVRTETSAHPLPDGEVRLLGAVHTVTGAMTRVETAGAKLLVLFVGYQALARRAASRPRSTPSPRPSPAPRDERFARPIATQRGSTKGSGCPRRKA